MNAIRLKPDELDLLAQMIDKRDSARLSGQTADPFRAAALNGGVTVLQFPGRTGSEQVPTILFQRLLSLDLFFVLSQSGRVTTFDLADDIRDRLEQLKMEAGQPSLLQQELANRARAEDRQSQLETQLAREGSERQQLRAAFAAKVGRWAYWTTTLFFAALYLAALVVSVIGAPALALALVIAVGLLGLASSLFHFDAFRISHAAERSTAARVERWLSRFEASDQPSGGGPN